MEKVRREYPDTGPRPTGGPPSFRSPMIKNSTLPA